MYCPICQNGNRQSKLVLKQINFSTAVYLCEEEKCMYPVGYEGIVVQRNLDDMYTWKEQPPVETACVNSSDQSDIDTWLDEIFDTAPPATTSLNNSDSNTFDLTELEMFLNSSPVDNMKERLEETRTTSNDEQRKRALILDPKPNTQMATNQTRNSKKISYTSYIIKPAVHNT